MTISIDDIRVGDADDKTWPLRVAVRRGEFSHSVWIGIDDIAEHHPAPKEIRAGDWVLWCRDKSPPCQVIAVDGKFAWLLAPNFARPTALISDLTPTDPPA